MSSSSPAGITLRWSLFCRDCSATLCRFVVRKLWNRNGNKIVLILSIIVTQALITTITNKSVLLGKICRKTQRCRCHISFVLRNIHECHGKLHLRFGIPPSHSPPTQSCYDGIKCYLNLHQFNIQRWVERSVEWQSEREILIYLYLHHHKFFCFYHPIVYRNVALQFNINSIATAHILT
jgi:hypothetical protein